MTRLASLAELSAGPKREDAVRVAQVGLAGGIGYVHANEHAKNPHIKYLGGFDLYPNEPKVAEAIQRIRGMGGKIYRSFDEIIADPQVEAVDICTPHHFHREMAVAAFKAGKHVLVEKPMATHPDDLEMMLAAQKASGKIGAVQMQHVGRSSMLDLRAAIQSGAIGKLKEVFLSSLWWRTDSYYGRIPWAGRLKIDGKWCIDGALFNQCIHYINEMLILTTPTPAVSVAGIQDMRSALYKFHDAPTLETEDTAFVTGTLDVPDKPRVTMICTTCSKVERHQIDIIGTKGRALWNGIGYLFPDGQPMSEFQNDNSEFDGSSRIFTSFAQAIRGKGDPLTPFTEIAKTCRAIYSVYEASQWKIKKAPWSATDTLFSDVIANVRQQRALPSELAVKTEWA